MQEWLDLVIFQFKFLEDLIWSRKFELKKKHDGKINNTTSKIGVRNAREFN